MRSFALRVIMIIAAAGLLAGCQQMGPTEVGVKFRKLPAPLGGLSHKVISPGEMAILMPWDSVYRFDTSVKDVSWPDKSSGRDSHGHRLQYVNTRALDGNEVALAVTVRYRVSTDPEKLMSLVQHVASNNEGVRDLVISVARADIRTHMNELRTSAFLDEESRYAAIDKVRSSMSRRLAEYGIEISRVILDDFRFERLLKDGSIDASYQEKLTEIQKLREDTERERSRIETVKAKKDQEFKILQASVNRQVAEADGYKQQAVLRGNAYFESKSNEGKGILALGKADVEGVRKQVEALGGPGGRSILRLEIARQLERAQPKFVLMNEGKSAQGLAVQRVEANDLLTQLGVFEGMSKPQRIEAPKGQLKISSPVPEQAPLIQKDRNKIGE
ncbi:MAG: hypothetical protein DCC75_07375 [Proteobacteria bacterium]|nr:MAG: hypothetical protein DCC75_07375 [Pseudomonadota bacterium]